MNIDALDPSEGVNPDHKDDPISEGDPGAVKDEPAPAPTRRNQFLKVDDPKNKQFTGRATQAEYDRINDAIEIRKTPGKTYDIVRLCLDMIDHIEADILQTFRTKKKR